MADELCRRDRSTELVGLAPHFATHLATHFPLLTALQQADAPESATGDPTPDRTREAFRTGLDLLVDGITAVSTARPGREHDAAGPGLPTAARARPAGT
ncbi:hypothetical protein PUR61_21765 [Streptomyces sp. BE20]|uniref:hypothetical protein n=1 Tax=Streptomyces sp. BE20 TaxID=3002525 RepID=UPI002E76EDDB|nr:hypothetical protein [Streptomyces sp. BE20]MEE1824787.1 hypothetical protein [Streptomyces sp. BE20]